MTGEDNWLYYGLMNKISVALFDVDGVVVLPPKPFSVVYAEEHGLNPDLFKQFFTGDFVKALTGKADIRDLIRTNFDIWHWDRDPQELLDQWCRAEDYPNHELIAVIQEYRKHGIRAYLATNQEMYRTKYLLEQTFPTAFDGIFASYTIGYTKHESAYWTAVLKQLAAEIPGILPEQIAYFDDQQDGVTMAHEAGIAAYLFTGLDQVQTLLGRLS